MIILLLLLSLLLFALGFIHLYWVFGGKWGFENALPTTENGKRVLNPKKIDSALVGLGLCFFGLYYLLQLDFFKVELPNWMFTYLGWIIPAIFLLRAIGDFKYIGFFKKISKTDFGKRDTKFFSPLCLIMGLIGV